MTAGAGFENTLVFSENADFSGGGATGQVALANGLQDDGELWIGSTALNAGNTHINVGTITSTGGTIAITYSSPNINIETTGSAGTAVTSFDVQANTPPGTDPVVPTAGGVVTVNGAVVAAHSVPIETRSRAANAYNVEVQYASAVAASTASQSGISHFDSDIFTVDAVGFVSTTAGSLVQTITGGPGITITGTAANPIVNSVIFIDQAITTTMTVDTGYFATAAITLNLPATADQGELIHVVVDTASAVVIDAPALNFIRLGSALSTSGGTITSNSIGDSLTLRYRLSTLTWHATASIGNWTLA